MVSSIGTPIDITVSELVIESFFPADPHTAAVLHKSFPTTHQTASYTAARELPGRKT
jgi:hypothetical protein